MKLLIAVVQDEDASALVSALMDHGFSVTKLATTGGFLRAGNTTLLMGVQDEEQQAAIEIIENVCKARKQYTAAPMHMVGVPGNSMNYPIEVLVGGATVFVLNVEQFIKV